jgi:hypothetical protein
MLVYRLLGQGAVDAFAKSFGISYALNQVSEWQDIVHEVVKAIVVMLILERLFISSPVGWMEEHIDYLSVQVRQPVAAQASDAPADPQRRR